MPDPLTSPRAPDTPPDISEERLAALTGFDDPNAPSPSVTNRRIDPDAGTSDMSPDEIEEEITRHTFASHPLVKLAFVSAGVLGIVLVGGAFIHALTGGGFAMKKREPPPQKFEQEIAKGDSIDKEKGEVLTTLALKEQEDALAKANERLNTEEEKAPRMKKTAPRQRAPRRVASRYVPPPPQPTPVVYRVPAPRPVPVVRPTPVAPPPDPYEQWLIASRMGAYGSTSPVPIAESSPLQRVVATRDESESDGVTFVGQRTAEAPRTLANDAIVIGTRATARFDRPIAFTDGQDPENPLRVTMRLSSPITSATGRELLQTGTQIVAELDASQAPLAVLRPLAFLAQHQGQWVEYPIDPESLVVTGTGAEPLVAKSKRVNRGGSDFGSAVLGALGEAGRAADIPAADVPARIYRRLDRSRGDRSYGSVRATRLYTLPAGLELELVAVRSFVPFPQAESAPPSADEEPQDRTPYLNTDSPALPTSTPHATPYTP